MAKLTIELTRDFTVGNNGIRTEMIGTNVAVTDLSPEGKTGPQDVLAHIIVSMMPGVIKSAGERLVQEMTARGNQAVSQMISGVKN